MKNVICVLLGVSALSTHCLAKDDRLESTYSHEGVSRVAARVMSLVGDAQEELARSHSHELLESPTARAVAEYAAKVSYIRDSGDEECLGGGSDNTLKDFRKRLAAVVLDCESGWPQDSDLTASIRSVLTTLRDLDDKAKPFLDTCRESASYSYCYNQLRRTPDGATVDNQLRSLAQSELVQLQLLSDANRAHAAEYVSRCNRDLTASLRAEVYQATADLTVCMASQGLLVDF